MYRKLLTLLSLFASYGLYAQSTDVPSGPIYETGRSGFRGMIKTEKRKADHPHAIMGNFPNYVQCAEYPGIGFGLEYRRFFRKQRNMMASVSLTRMFWAGTQETGENYRSGHRANIGASLLGTGWNYLPLGSNGPVILELGAVALLGQIRRMDFFRPGRSSGDVYHVMERSFFASPQGHIGITFQARGLYQFSLYGEFGPILTAGSETRGNYATIGMKFGSRL